MVYVEVYMNCNHKWPWGLLKLTNVSTYVLIKSTYVFVVLQRIIVTRLLLYWDVNILVCSNGCYVRNGKLCLINK
jgi:hypothetical protein